MYQATTDRIVAALEAGTVPWRKPWSSWNGRPQNMDGRHYRGINLILLSMSGYECPFWGTFKQFRSRGGSVNKGEHGTPVVFWSLLKDRDDPEKRIPLLRNYTVFNLMQTHDVKEPDRVKAWRNQEGAPFEPVTDADVIVKGYPDPPTIRSGGEAYYVPALDTITVPPVGAFNSPAEFYATLFHEMGHSTGHPSRLDRFEPGSFGSHAYGREELVAEMTAAFLCAEAGIDATLDNSAAYLSSWVRTIKEDNRAVIVAAGAAQKAADLILDRHPEGEAER
jgi:antirestriction protein ArdC